MADNQQGDRPLDYGEINAELESLEGKNDPASNERRAGLLDDLMTIDMGMGGDRRAMGRASSGSARPADAESQPESPTSNKSPTSGGITIIGAMGPRDSHGEPPQTPTESSTGKTSGGCMAVIGFHAPESESSKRERRIRDFFLRNLEWIAGKARDGGGDCYISFDLRDDQRGAESDQPPKTDEAQPNRFVQFFFSSDKFLMDLPKTILSAAEAEAILRDRPGFFFLSTRQKSEDPNARVNEYNPVQREYANGEERIAAEDLAYVLFDVWKLPVSVPLEVKAGRF